MAVATEETIMGDNLLDHGQVLVKVKVIMITDTLEEITMVIKLMMVVTMVEMAKSAQMKIFQI